MLTIVLVGVAVLVFGGVGLALALGGGGSGGPDASSDATTRSTVAVSTDADGSTTEPNSESGAQGSASTGAVVTTAGPTSSAAAQTSTVVIPGTTAVPPAPLPTTTTGIIREAQIFAMTVKIRSEPDPTTEDNVLVKFVPENEVLGTVIQVLGTNIDGWYHVRYQGLDGWMFGTFILPPDPELVVWQSPEENTLELLSAGGVPVDFPGYDSTGDKVLVRVTGAPYRSTLPNGRQLLRVLLPDGGEAWVDEATVVARLSFPE